MSKHKNPHEGSSFDDWLKEEGIYEEVSDRGFKKAQEQTLNSSQPTRNDIVGAFQEIIEDAPTLLKRTNAH